MSLFFSFRIVLYESHLLSSLHAEVDTISIPARQIITPPPSSPSDFYTVISERSSTTLSLSDPTYTSRHALPFAISRATLYPSIPPSQSISYAEKDLVVAAIAKSGQVALLGSDSALRRIRPSAYEDSANLQAALNTVEASNENLRPVRLFDELFGESSLSSSGPSTSSAATISSLPAVSGTSGNKRDIFDEIPSHKLPSLSALWRDLITPALIPIAGPSTSSSGSKGKNAQGATVKDEDASDDEDDEDIGEVQMDGEDEQVQSDEDDHADARTKETQEETTYVNLPEEELIEIFSKSMDAFSIFKGKGIPNDRLASKAGKDKTKKKRKSLLASMV